MKDIEQNTALPLFDSDNFGINFPEYSEENISSESTSTKVEEKPPMPEESVPTGKSEANLRNKKNNRKGGSFPVYRKMSEIEPKPVNWLWEDYIAKGATLDEVLNGQYLSVKNLWEDASLLPDDPWLLANYSFTDENGNRRFRSSQELMTHARTHMDKFQYSNESKDFHNDFITGAARMFRSSY